MYAKLLALLGSFWISLLLFGALTSSPGRTPAASAAACADLLPQVTLSANPPQINQLFTIQITITNQGDQAAGRFRTYLYLDPPQQPPTAATVDTTSFGVFGLAVQEQMGYEYDHTFTITGSHTIYVWVDRDNQVAGECDESNNLAMRTLSVGIDPGCTPDRYEATRNNLCTTAPRMVTDGAVQRHNLCAAGDQDWVSFEGVAGVEYTMIAGNGEADADIQLALFDRCDAPALHGSDPTLGRAVRMKKAITQSGIYYLQVKHHDDTYGPHSGYDLAITASCSIDSFEPDDQCTLARELQPNSAAQRRSFCAAQDADWALLPAVAGETYEVRTQHWEAKSQPRLTLYNTCGGEIIQQGAARGALTWTAPQTGAYRVRVMNDDGALAGLTTGYELVVNRQAQPEEATEPNDTPVQARVLPIGRSVPQQAFAFPGDQDWFYLDVTAGQPLRLETGALAPATDTYLCLYHTDGASLLTCDDDSGAGLGSKLLWSASTAGRYYVRLHHVAPAAGGAGATYTLTATTTFSECDPDAYEPDNHYGQARDVVPGAPAQSHTICTGHDADWVRFWVQTPGIYAIRADAQGADADPLVALYAVDGQTLLFQNDDYGPGLGARILWPFTQAGVYYVRVQAFNAQANGNGTDYRLHISQSQELPTPLPTTPPPPTPTFTPSPTPTATPTPTAPPEATPTPTGPIKTLIVTYPQRFAQRYDPSAVQSLTVKLQALAQVTGTPGILLDLADFFAVTEAYRAWDQAPADLAKGNAVADAIRSVIWSQLERYPQIEFIVLIGDDLIIPHRRESYAVKEVNEQTYAQKELADTTTIGQALRQGVMVTDDFYASRQPQAVDGRLLYLPDKALGRLIETPDEISRTIERFLQNSQLHRATALVVASNMDATRLLDAKAICRQMQPYWGTQIRCETNATAWGGSAFTQWHLTANPAPDLHVVGVRAKHWTMEMADGSFLAAETVAGQATTLEEALVLAFGSHSGLNVPAHDRHPLDWPQFYTQRGALLIANSSSELFFTNEALGLSRKLFANVARQLMVKTTVGAALVAAKQSYLQEARTPSLHDRHILQQTLLYSLPMYRLPLALSAPNEFPSVTLGGMTAATGGRTVTAGSIVTGSLTVGLDGSFQALARATTASGAYYELDGHVNWKPGDAGQPLYFVDLDRTLLGELGTARGVLWLGGVYTDVLEANLLIPQVVNGEEPISSRQALTTTTNPFIAHPIPAQLDPTGKRMIVEWGHYDATTQRQRLYGHVALELTFSASPDTLAPTVQQRAAQVTATGIAIKIEAVDASGIRRVVATYSDGNGLFQSLDLIYRPDMDKWVGVIPGLRRAIWFAQVVDGAGNVAYVLDKGQFFYAEATESLNYLYLPTAVR